MNAAIMPLLLFGVFLNAAAQFLLKFGLEKIGHFNFSWINIAPITQQILINPYILVGFFCYGVSVIIWLMVLSRVDVSIAYPMVSLGYVVTAIGAYYLLGENLSLARIAGIIIILLGVFLISRT